MVGDHPVVHPIHPTPRLELLGGFQLTVARAPVSLPLPAQRLMAVLALHGKPLQRSYVAGLLWPDVSEDRARGNLRSTLWRLGGAHDLVDGRDHVSIHRRVEVDIARTSAIARQVIGEQADLGPEILEALVTGAELLPDWYDDWLVFEREQFNQLRLLALDCLGRQLLRRHRVPEASLAALTAVRIEPLRESAQHLLIDCLIRQGNRAAAVRQYQSYADMLRRDMGLVPSPAISDLVASLVA
jgi:DNA-binding SARP family transcriptional activator